VYLEETMTPAQILKKENFHSMYIITHNENSVTRIKDWLKTGDLAIDYYILQDRDNNRFIDSINGRAYLGDILVYEYAKGKHIWDHVNKSSIENRLFKKHLQGNNVSSIITQLEKWIEKKY
jgi:hypothetical protein